MCASPSRWRCSTRPSARGARRSGRSSATSPTSRRMPARCISRSNGCITSTRPARSSTTAPTISSWRAATRMRTRRRADRTAPSSNSGWIISRAAVDRSRFTMTTSTASGSASINDDEVMLFGSIAGAAASNATPALVSAMLDSGPGISDLIFSPGRPPQVERHGDLATVNIPELPLLRPEHTARIARDLIGGNAQNLRILREEGAVDLSYAIAERSRFRVNVFRQRGTYAIVMRVIASKIPSLADLNLPPAIADAAALKNGIVLVTGPTGSGKSSTLAAIIDLINESRAEHILTIEDPIEFLHQHKKGTVHQRELHTDTPTFALALRAALRQAPKVILVGEMRDRETIEIALTAAETGHLVFSTLHTIDASKTVERIIGTFEASDQHAMRT